jgi:hypothetical protein
MESRATENFATNLLNPHPHFTDLFLQSDGCLFVCLIVLYLAMFSGGRMIFKPTCRILKKVVMYFGNSLFFITHLLLPYHSFYDCFIVFIDYKYFGELDFSWQKPSSKIPSDAIHQYSLTVLHKRH